MDIYQAVFIGFIIGIIFLAAAVYYFTRNSLKEPNVKMPVDRCVCCGEIVPEGRWICPNCEKKHHYQGGKR